MKLNKILVNSIVATVLSLNLQAKVTMPAIFTDGMVLQQESKVPIWGSTDKKVNLCMLPLRGTTKNTLFKPMRKVNSS